MPFDLSLADLLDQSVGVCLDVADKGEAIGRLVALVAGAEAVVDADRLGEDVRAREAQMSTGVGGGLGLPHARTDAVTATVAAFATLDPPVAFDALDGEPVRLAFLLAGPEADRARHLRLLSRVSRVMSDPALRQRLYDAATPAEVLAAIRDAEAALV
ncbi:MAG: PTS sugar transporter subunit IIA [Bacteroidota bacterium]